MIVTIAGLPGRLTDMVRDVCRELLIRAGRNYSVIDVAECHPEYDPKGRNLDMLGALASSLLETQADFTLALARAPDEAFARALTDAGHPFILVLERPVTAAAELMEAGVAPIQATRVVAQSCACLTSLLNLPFAARLGSGLEQDAMALSAASTLLRVLQIPPDDTEVQWTKSLIQAVFRARPEISRVPPEVDTMTRAALSGYGRAFAGGTLDSIVATREMFVGTEPSGAPLGASVDLTGRPRMLAFGPYIAAPKGAWTLRLTLAFSSGVDGQPFAVDILGGRRGVASQLGRTSFQAIEGAQIVQANFSNPDPDALLQFRLFSERALFDGQASIGFAELRPRADLPVVELSEAITWDQLGAEG